MLSILYTNINDRWLIIKTSQTKKMEAYNIPFLLCILTSHLIYDFIFIYGINILILTTMLANHSPDKQNRSPESHRLVKKTHKKNGQSENEQIDFAYKNSSPSPTRRKSNNLDQFDCQFKLIDCAPDQALWKTKALLADREFEVKKLQQDFAEYKLLSRMQKQKALKKLRDQLQSQKRKHGEEIKKWEAKFEQMQDNQQKQLKKYKTQIQIYYKKHEENQLNNLREKYGKQLNISELKCEMIEQQLRLMCKQLKERHQLQMQELKLMYQKEKEEMKNIHNEEIKKKEQIFQIKVMQVETQKQTKIKLVEETKKQTIMKEQKYLTQIGKMQRQRKALSQKYDEIEMKYKVMNKRYEDKQRQIQTLKKEHQTQIKELSDQLQKNRRQTEQKIQKQRLKILKDEYEKTERLQNKLINLEQVKEKIIDQHLKNQRVLERKFELRESRKEDIEIIKEIETELAYKERQKNRLYQNLKLAKLQRQNDDKIYTRIFTSSRSKRKSSTNRNNSDIYAILKQSHTADFRHLLKLSKKNEKQNHK